MWEQKRCPEGVAAWAAGNDRESVKTCRKSLLCTYTFLNERASCSAATETDIR